MGYQRFVALGDSCTEGLDDLHPAGGVYRGWADLVAARLAADEPDFRYANLGVRGRRLDQITVEQVPALPTLAPDLVALFGGGNDVLSSGFDAATVARRVDTAVRAVTESAPKVVVFTLCDLTRQTPFSGRLRSRIEALNDAIREAATNYRAVLVDLWPDHAVDDSRYFGRDRLHLSHLGHQRLAGHLLNALGVPFTPDWLEPLPGSPVRPDTRAQVEWLWRELRPVAVSRFRNRLTGRSPGDGFRPKRPELLPLPREEISAWIPANA